MSATDAGTRVYASRTQAFELGELPALMVTTDRDDWSGAVGFGAGTRRMEHSLRVTVMAATRAQDGVDDNLDELARQVEVALAMPCAAMTGLAQTITLTGTQLQIDDNGTQPVGRAALSYDVVYGYNETAPDQAQ